MRKTWIFPTILIILDVAAGMMYLPDKPHKVVYWLAAATLTAMVTYFE